MVAQVVARRCEGALIAACRHNSPLHLHAPQMSQGCSLHGPGFYFAHLRTHFISGTSSNDRSIIALRCHSHRLCRPTSSCHE